MNHSHSRRLLFGALLVVLLAASTSTLNAELIVFASGRTLSVQDYRLDGDAITVTLQGGGEATFARALVAEVRPDEVHRPVPPADVTTAMRQGVPSLSTRPFAALIETVSARHGVDPALVHAVIAAESNYRPTATSRAGARGLMQVMPATAREFGITSRSLFDPQQNLETGVRYLKLLLQRFDGDLPTALAAYNAGPGAVSRHEGIPPYPETLKYVRKVLSDLQQ